MDGAFGVPGTRIRFGVDSMIGLVPGLGDVVGGIVSATLIYEAGRHDAPKRLIARMLANTVLDTTVGSVPVIGDLFDVFYKVNLRNMALLRQHLEEREGRRLD